MSACKPFCPDTGMPIEEFRAAVAGMDAFFERMASDNTVRHDPDVRIKATHWPPHMEVSIDSVGGGWICMSDGSFDSNCPRCRGHISLRGSYARYCPWCGERLGDMYEGYTYWPDDPKDEPEEYKP